MTWRRVPAPVRHGMLPGRWRRRDGAPAKRVGLTVYRPSDSTRRSAGYAPCGPSAWRQNRVRDERCNCIRRKRCCSRPAPCCRARPLLGGRRVVVEPAGTAGPIGNPPVPLLRPCQNPVPAVLGRHCGQPDGGLQRVCQPTPGRFQRRWCPGRWNGQLRHRMARANLDPLPARMALLGQIPLPNKGSSVRVSRLSDTAPVPVVSGLFISGS